jgi:hypothetical protein
MQQISEAVACLGPHGYAHDDPNLRNILFDSEDNLPLADLDLSLKAGEDLDVGEEPYIRGTKVGESGGSNGVAGPITEQLAFGPIFWFTTRCTKIYHDAENPER